MKKQLLLSIRETKQRVGLHSSDDIGNQVKCIARSICLIYGTISQLQQQQYLSNQYFVQNLLSIWEENKKWKIFN